MTRAYKKGIADGKWDFSFDVKGYQVAFSNGKKIKGKAYQDKEEDHTHYSATFHDGDLTMKLTDSNGNEHEVIDGRPQGFMFSDDDEQIAKIKAAIDSSSNYYTYIWDSLYRWKVTIEDHLPCSFQLSSSLGHNDDMIPLLGNVSFATWDSWDSDFASISLVSSYYNGISLFSDILRWGEHQDLKKCKPYVSILSKSEITPVDIDELKSKLDEIKLTDSRTYTYYSAQGRVDNVRRSYNVITEKDKHILDSIVELKLKELEYEKKSWEEAEERERKEAHEQQILERYGQYVCLFNDTAEFYSHDHDMLQTVHERIERKLNSSTEGMTTGEEIVENQQHPIYEAIEFAIANKEEMLARKFAEQVVNNYSYLNKEYDKYLNTLAKDMGTTKENLRKYIGIYECKFLLRMKNLSENINEERKERSDKRKKKLMNNVMRTIENRLY